MIKDFITNHNLIIDDMKEYITNYPSTHDYLLHKFTNSQFEYKIFAGPIECYKKFKISPEEVPYSIQEHEFRITCLQEEIDELIVAKHVNIKHEVIDAIVDLLFFAVGTVYRKDLILESTISYPAFNHANLLKLSLNHKDDLLQGFIVYASEYVKSIKEYDNAALYNLISLCYIYLSNEYNSDIEPYYERVTAANLSKELGSLPKRGSFALDLVKPEGWKPPSFEGLSL